MKSKIKNTLFILIFISCLFSFIFSINYYISITKEQRELNKIAGYTNKLFIKYDDFNDINKNELLDKLNSNIFFKNISQQYNIDNDIKQLAERSIQDVLEYDIKFISRKNIISIFITLELLFLIICFIVFIKYIFKYFKNKK